MSTKTQLTPWWNYETESNLLTGICSEHNQPQQRLIFGLML